MSDKYEELEKLQSLKEREIISEEEFQVEKEKILNAPEKKDTKIKSSTLIFIVFVLILIGSIICVISVNNKGKSQGKTENETVNQEDVNDNENTVLEDNEEETFENLTVKYEYQSADSYAAQGNPAILKIFEINEKQLKFEYNKGFNFETSTIDRNITGVAEINAYKYEYFEEENKYTIEFEIFEDDLILKEYIDGEFTASINLFLVTDQDVAENVDIEKALTNYYDLISASNCDYLLEELAEKGDLSYDQTQNNELDNGLIITPIKKSEFKSAMLNYISEEEYNRNWDECFGENEEGYLTKVNGGGNNPVYTIESIEQVEANHYIAEISYIIDETDREEVYNEVVEVYVNIQNDKCVVDLVEKAEITPTL